MEAAKWFIFFACAVLTVGIGLAATLKLNTSMISGVIAGMCYFLGLPLLLCALLGEIRQDDLPIAPLMAHKDGAIAGLILSCMLSTALGAFLLQRKVIDRESEPIKKFEGIELFTLLMFYLLFVVIFFVGSGKWRGGGHWYTSTGDAFNSSPTYVVLANFLNVFRVAVPAALAYNTREMRIKPITFWWLLAAYCSTELLLMNNRIGLLFSAVAVLLAFPKYRIRLSLSAIPFVPIVGFLNHAFPIARGLMWSSDASPGAIINAFSRAVESRADFGAQSNSMQEVAFSLCEGSNLNVVKFVFYNYSFDNCLWGQSVIVKSASFIIPKSIWTEKPDGFGLTIGRAISGIDHLTLNTTSVGEFWGNFGALSVLMLPLLLILVYCVSRIILPLPQQQLALFMCGIASVRFEFSFLIIALFCLTMNSGICWIMVGLNNRLRSRTR